MRVLYFGSYVRSYPRNRIIMKGLRENGVVVDEFNYFSSHVRLFPRLVKGYSSNYDAMIVGFPGHSNIPLARLLTKFSRKPLVFDAFLSVYDSAVFDRRTLKAESLKSKRYFYRDKFACMMSDIVLLDTNEHINYFHEEFGIENEKFRRVFVGTDDEIFYPMENIKNSDTFIITFQGTFIPLQGIQYIIKAAKLLENDKDIKIEILGSGQTYNSILNLSSKLKICNVVFKERVPYNELPNFIARGDVCLGIFGDTSKAKKVIPNKVYETLAMKKPLITGNTPAIKEAGIINRKHALLVEMANPEAITNAILELKEDINQRESIAEKGYELFKENFTPKIIGQEVKEILKEVI